MKQTSFKASQFLHANVKPLPERKRSHEAGEHDRARARRRLKRIARMRRSASAPPQIKEEHVVEQVIQSQKTKFKRPGTVLNEHVRSVVMKEIEARGSKEVCLDIENIAPHKRGTDSARSMLRTMISDAAHRWSTTSHRLLCDLAAHYQLHARPDEMRRRGVHLTADGKVITVIGETVRGGSTAGGSAARAEPEPAPEPDPVSEPEQPAQPETQHGQSIVSIDGFDFCVASESHDVRITSEELAAKLGYGKRHKLEELAARHSEFINRIGDVPTVGISVRRGFHTSIEQIPTYNRQQTLYLIAKCELPVANELTVRLIGAFDKLLEMSARGNAAHAQPPHQNVSLATEVTAAMSPMFSMMLESQARTNEMFLKAIAELRHAPSDHFEAKPFSELSQGHQAAIIANMVRTHADQLASEGIPNEYSVAWNILYSEYEEDTGDLVRKTAAAESDSSGSRVRPFDLLKREGKLVQLMASARKVFFRTKH